MPSSRPQSPNRSNRRRGTSAIQTPTLPAPDAMLDAVFAALAAPARRRMLDLVRASPGTTIASLVAHFDMSAVGVLKHVRVLEHANLLLTQKHGRERLLYVNLVPIQQIYDRWTDSYASFWSAQMVDLKDRLESRTPAARNGVKKRA